MKRRFCVLGSLLLIALLMALPCFAAKTKKPYEGKVVNVLYMSAGPVQNFANLLSDFEKETGAKVNFTIIGEKNYDEKADLELTTPKGAYDVIWIPWRTFHRWGKAGWLAPLDDFISNPKIADSKVLKISGFSPKLYTSLNYKGKQLGLPVMGGAEILNYRTDIFANYGIKSPPQTWQEMMMIAKKIHTPQVAAVAMRGSKASGGVGFQFPMVLKAFGGDIVKDFPKNMQPDLDNPKSIKAAEFYSELLRNYGFPGAPTGHFVEILLAVQQGRVAMFPAADVLTGQFLDPAKSVVTPDKLGFALIPKGDVARVSAGTVHGLGIPRNSQNQELGFKFMEWALSEKTQLANCLKHNTTSVTRPDLMKKREYLAKFNWGNGQWAKVVAESFSKYADPLYRPMTPEWNEVEQALGVAMSKVLTGQESAVKALTEANSQIYEIYKQAGYYQ